MPNIGPAKGRKFKSEDVEDDIDLENVERLICETVRNV